MFLANPQPKPVQANPSSRKLVRRLSPYAREPLAHSTTGFWPPSIDRVTPVM